LNDIVGWLTQSLTNVNSEAQLVQKCCNEIVSATRLRAILGIILYLGNKVNSSGPTDNLDQARAISVTSLLKLNQAKTSDDKTTFLQYVVKIIRQNDATLLNFREDFLSLYLVEKIQWDELTEKLEMMESNLAYIKGRAVEKRGDMSLQESDIKEKEISPDDELDLLQSSPLGIFVLESCLRMNSLYEDINNAKNACTTLLDYFGEEQHDMGVSGLLRTLFRFCNDFDIALQQVITSEEEEIWGF
jgi:BNI1-related protein 1